MRTIRLQLRTMVEEFQLACIKEGVSALEVVMTKIERGANSIRIPMYVGGLRCWGLLCERTFWILTARVYRDGKVWEQTYERGKSLAPIGFYRTPDQTGTIVTFKPDSQIFSQTREYNYDTLALRMRELAYLNKGITISLIDKRNKDDKGEFIQETFHSERLERIYRFFR